MSEQTVGPVSKASRCAGCGALVPNTWSDPRGYGHSGDRVYCSAACIDRDVRIVGDPRAADVVLALARLERGEGVYDWQAEAVLEAGELAPEALTLGGDELWYLA